MMIMMISATVFPLRVINIITRGKSSNKRLLALPKRGYISECRIRDYDPGSPTLAIQDVRITVKLKTINWTDAVRSFI